MATRALGIIIQVASQYGGSNSPRTYPEAGSQTFAKGELVYLNQGALTEVASDTPGVILGVANQAAHNTTIYTTRTSVSVGSEGILFEGNMVSMGGADRTIANTDLGRVAGIYRDTANSKVYVNGSVTGGSSARVFVHGLAKDNQIGDVNARVLFEFLPAFIQNRTTS